MIKPEIEEMEKKNGKKSERTQENLHKINRKNFMILTTRGNPFINHYYFL